MLWAVEMMFCPQGIHVARDGLLGNSLDQQVMFQLKRRDPSDVEQGLLRKLLRDVPPAQVHDVLLEAVAV